MRKSIRDGLLVVAAILLTGSAAYAMQPSPVLTTTLDVQQETVIKPVESPVKAPIQEKVVTWQDNPNSCTDSQWIDVEPPFGCIDKAVEPVAQPAVRSAPVVAGTTSGNCYQWLLDAGVTDMQSAVELQRRENAGCNPQQYNSGGSDACGVAQELPCGKSGCGLPPSADGACQIRWMNSYVLGRYGSWANALQHSYSFNWY